MKFRDAFVLSAISALFALPLAGPLSDWMYAHFEFVRYHPVIVNVPPIEPLKLISMQSAETARVTQDAGKEN